MHALLLGLALFSSAQVSAQKLGEQMDSFGINGMGSAQTTPSRLGESLKTTLDKQPRTPLWEQVRGVMGNLIRVLNPNSARVNQIAGDRQSLIHTDIAQAKVEPKVEELMKSLQEQLAGQSLDKDKLEELKKDLRERFAKLAEQDKLGDPHAVNAAFESAVADHLGKDVATKVASNVLPKESPDAARSVASNGNPVLDKISDVIAGKSDSAVAKAINEDVDAPKEKEEASAPSSGFASNTPSPANLAAAPAPVASAAPTPEAPKAETPAPAAGAQPEAPKAPVVNAPKVSQPALADSGSHTGSIAPIATKDPVSTPSSAADSPAPAQRQPASFASGNGANDDGIDTGFNDAQPAPSSGGSSYGPQRGLADNSIPSGLSIPLSSAGTVLTGGISIGVPGSSAQQCASPLQELQGLMKGIRQIDSINLAQGKSLAVLNAMKGDYASKCSGASCSAEEAHKTNAFAQRLNMAVAAANKGIDICGDNNEFKSNVQRILKGQFQGTESEQASEAAARAKFQVAFGSNSSGSIDYYKHIVCGWLQYRVAKNASGGNQNFLGFQGLSKNAQIQNPACFQKDLQLTAKLLPILQRKAKECGYGPADLDYFSPSNLAKFDFEHDANPAASQAKVSNFTFEYLGQIKKVPSVYSLAQGGSTPSEFSGFTGSEVRQILGSSEGREALPSNCKQVADLFDLVRRKAMTQPALIAQLLKAQSAPVFADTSVEGHVVHGGDHGDSGGDSNWVSTSVNGKVIQKNEVTPGYDSRDSNVINSTVSGRIISSPKK
ncbi:MAG: hypothetical protein JST16_06610 [Bdellovibrionales bacterium]|nr:hypothetical protein [Bdellovibrionales bacterium]